MSLSYDTALQAERTSEQAMKEPVNEARHFMERYFRDRIKEYFNPEYTRNRSVEAVRGRLSDLQKDNPARPGRDKVKTINKTAKKKDLGSLEKSGIKKAMDIKRQVSGKGAVSLDQAKGLVKGAAEKAGKEAGKEAAKTIAKETAKKAISAAAKTNPVTLAVEEAVKAAEILAKRMKEVSRDTRAER